MAKLSVIEKKPNQNVIADLELTLEQSRKGELSGIVIIRSWDDNSTTHSWAFRDNSVRIVGELMIAATTLARNIDEAES